MRPPPPPLICRHPYGYTWHHNLICPGCPLWIFQHSLESYHTENSGLIFCDNNYSGVYLGGRGLLCQSISPP